MTREIDFKNFSSIKIGSKIDVLVIDEVEDYTPYQIIGGANNLLVSPNCKNLAILSKKFNYIKRDGEFLHIGASTPTGKVLNFCKRENIANFEFLSKLPGSIGGAVKMNAGLKEYEIFNNLIAIKTKDGYIKRDEIKYGYRFTDIDSIIYEAIFKIESNFSNELAKKFLNIRSKQPKEPSAGSCFKNPKGDFAGRLLEAVKLKGYRVNGASFSDIHSNFLVNLGDATFEDAMELIKVAKERVYQSFGVVLEEEITIL